MLSMLVDIRSEMDVGAQLNEDPRNLGVAVLRRHVKQRSSDERRER